MGTFKIEGGHKLKGTLTPQGAKNEALQILAAVLLSPEKITLKNNPKNEKFNTNFLIFGLTINSSFIEDLYIKSKILSRSFLLAPGILILEPSFDFSDIFISLDA